MAITAKIVQFFVGAAAIGVYLWLLVGLWPPPNVHGNDRWFGIIFSVMSNAPILAFSLFVCIVLREWTIVFIGIIFIAGGILFHFIVSVLAGHSNSVAILLFAFVFEVILFAVVSFSLLRHSNK